MEDTSLDEFLDTDGEDVEPATPTVRWSPERTACEACGARVRRRWQSESGLVCADCTEW
jgi:hypothetical protein